MSTETQQPGAEGERSFRFYVRKVKRHPAFRLWKMPFDATTQLVPSAWRLATQRFRHLPTVVIIGAQKAGTTQLFSYLVKHPRVLGGAEKEVHYFSKHPEQSVEWYRSRFPLRRLVAARNAHVVEASPSYLPMPGALRHMQSVLPEARVIVLLRDPVSRAFSHYQHSKTRHLESRSFEQAVANEQHSNVYLPAPGAALRPDAPPMLGYVARGYYALQLELVFELYSRARVLVIDSADLFSDTAAVCRRVFAFLGVEAFDVPPGKIYNRGFYREKIGPRVAERLREHYGPYDELLKKLLGAQFQWMAGRRPLAA
jgi:hypothetical protein